MKISFAALAAFGFIALQACAVPTGSEKESAGSTSQAMYDNGGGRPNSCSASQLSGGYEDVDGECMLTCWNCPGYIGGGSGNVPGGCVGETCGGGGGGGGGGGTTPPRSCDATYNSCFDACPPEPVLPVGDKDPSHLAAQRNAQRCYARCETAHRACGGY